MSELEIIRHPTISGISVFFDTVEYRTPHFHPEWELIWITEGTLRIQCSQRTMLGQTGDLFLFSPNQLHEFSRSTGPATFLCLQIAPQCFSQTNPDLRSIMAEESELGRSLDEERLEQLRQLLRRLMQSYLDQEPFFALQCTGLCAELLCLIFQAVPLHRMSEEEQSSVDKRNDRLSRFLSFVDENYMHKIRLSDFAEGEGCSVGYMSRFLKENLNQTFQEYVNSIRYHSACRMIRSGGMRMLDISVEAGFSDYRYFSNCFKKFTGMTPEEYSRSSYTEEPTRQKSIYSRERFYTREESLEKLRSLR